MGQEKAIIRATVPLFIEKKLMEICEVEILQGKRVELPGDMVVLEFMVDNGQMVVSKIFAIIEASTGNKMNIRKLNNLNMN